MLIRGLRIWPPLILAPMAGLTHSALRSVILSFGGVGLLSTEMLSASSLPAENERLSPYLIRTPHESPLSHQVLASRPEQLPPAFSVLHRLQAEAIDLNLGCPAPRVRRAGGGSSLSEDHARLKQLIAVARKATQLPLSAKIRLGESLNAKELRNLCLLLEGEGIDLLTVHARLRKEPFSRRPRWEWVAQVKDWLRIPVIANGSIECVRSARECLRQSKADGLMIGRAAASRPWIFADIARELYGRDAPTAKPCLPSIYAKFSAVLIQRFPPERRLGRLKEFTHYFAKNYFFGHHLASQVQASRSFNEACNRARLFLLAHDGDSEQAFINEAFHWDG